MIRRAIAARILRHRRFDPEQRQRPTTAIERLAVVLMLWPWIDAREDPIEVTALDLAVLAAAEPECEYRISLAGETLWIKDRDGNVIDCCDCSRQREEEDRLS